MRSSCTDPCGHKTHSKDLVFVSQHLHGPPLEQTTSVPMQGKWDQRGVWFLLQNIFICGRESHLCCQRLCLKLGLNASADNGIKVITYLVPLGTRTTNRTLKISKRRKANELRLLLPCEFLVWSDTRSARGQSQSPSCQVRGYKPHRHFLETRRDFSTPAGSVTLSTVPGLCCGTVSQPVV